jgi:hypothetical protein
MATAGARCRARVDLLRLIDGGDLGWRSNAQAFDVRAFATTCKSRPRNSNRIVKG